MVFHPLDQAQIRQIAGIQIQYLEKRLAESRTSPFEITTEALDILGQSGFDPVYGARPRSSARFSSAWKNPLAQKDPGGEYGPGDTIKVDAAEGALVFWRLVYRRSEIGETGNRKPFFLFQNVLDGGDHAYHLHFWR